VTAGKKKAAPFGRRLWGTGISPVKAEGLTSQQPQCGLRQHIGLRQHRRARLHQDVQLRKLRALVRHVHVLDPAVGRREILVEDRELLARQVQSLDVGSDLRPHVGQRLDRGLDLSQG